METMRIRLELKDDNLSDVEKVKMKRYANSLSGDSFVRDIIIPKDMPLHHVHYAIQKLFGWQNSHLRSFTLDEDVFKKITNNKMEDWAALVGVLFQTPSEAKFDIFWDDDYNDMITLNKWLKLKYTGPYTYGGYFEHYEHAQDDINETLNALETMDVMESFSDFYERTKGETNQKPKLLRIDSAWNLSMDEFNQSIDLGGSLNHLLERLTLSDIIPKVANKINYTYDFGTNWEVGITIKDDYEDLLSEYFITEDEIEEAIKEVKKSYKPVCIFKSGISLLDDVGGISGFITLLTDIHEGDKITRTEALTWAKSMGFSLKDKSAKNII